MYIYKYMFWILRQGSIAVNLHLALTFLHVSMIFHAIHIGTLFLILCFGNEFPQQYFKNTAQRIKEDEFD